MKTRPTKLILVILLFGAVFLLLDDHYASTYWADLAVDSLSLAVGIGIIDRILDRHEQRRWARADAIVGRRVRDFASASLTLIANALPKDRQTLSDYALTHTDEPEYGLASRWVRDVVEPRIEPVVHNADVTTRHGIAEATKDILALSERLAVVIGPRLEPDDLEALLAVGDLCSRILWPFSAVPELTARETSPSARIEVTRMWSNFGATVGHDLRALSQTLRALDASGHRVSS